ncbi:MAG: pepA [Parcubacteria group bacterium]|nr:pepA [Parcubacteria group bacterium]
MQIEINTSAAPAEGVAVVSLTMGSELPASLVRTDGIAVSELQVNIGAGPWEVERVVRQAVRAAVSFKLPAIQLNSADFIMLDRTLFSERSLGKMMARGALMGAYVFDDYLTNGQAPMRINLIGDDEAFLAGVQEGTVIGQCVNEARTLSNTPANIATPAELARCAHKMAASEANITVRVLEDQGLKREDLNLIRAVGRGARGTHGPRLIVIEYSGKPDNDIQDVIIGKGVCYDTGGNSMKSSDNMPGMHRDKSGGVTVLKTIQALSQLKARVNVVGLIPAVENSVDGDSYRPDDIIETAAGISVEVTNTDAEGRLILADALWYAKRYCPDTVIDIATLTGAAHIALGDAYSGVFSTNKTLLRDLITAGEAGFDPLWELPLGPRYAHYLRSTQADIANACMSGKSGGASSAAWFLHRFAEKAGFAENYAHLDIAPRMVQVFPDEHLAPGSMGAGVSLFVEYFLSKQTP